MTKTRRLAVILAVGAVTSLALAGCAPAADPDAKTVLTVYGWMGADPNIKSSIDDINAGFEKANPNITVDYLPITAGDGYSTKLQTELLAGGGPDVLQAQGTALTQWAENGYFADQTDAAWAGTVIDGIKPFMSYEDKLYALPLGATGVGLYANMDVLAAAGIDEVPTDWPAFIKAADKAKAAGFIPLSLPDKLGWTGALTFLEMGATTVPEEWHDAYWNGNEDFEAWRPVLNQLLDVDKKGYLSWKDELGIDEFAQGLTNFEAGKTAFWMQGEWNVKQLATDGLNVKFTAFPAGDAGTSPKALVFGGAGWAANANAKNPDAAAKYLAYWADPDVMLQYLSVDGGNSPLEGGTSPATPGMEDFLASFAAGDYQFMQTNTWFGGDVQTQIGSKLQELFLGQITVDQTISDLNDIGLKKE